MTKDEVKKLRMNSPESLQFLNNATKFYNLMMMYRCAIREIQTKLEVLDDEFSVENNRNPISFIKTRIKQPNSIYDKLQKMGYEFTTENIQTYLNDVAGVRIVCAFIDDIYMISDLITQQDDIKVIEIKDYIKNPKSNGYRSYHMIVEIPVFFAKGKTPMRVELQIRTNGMDFWATLEHQLRYKKGIEEMPGYDEISEELLTQYGLVNEISIEMLKAIGELEFGGALTKLMGKHICNYSGRLLKSVTGLDIRTISNMKKGENLTKLNVISACLGIHIPYRVSDRMLQLADLTLNMTSLGKIGTDNETYDMLLHLKWATDYGDVYDELKEQSLDYLIHQPPL